MWLKDNPQEWQDVKAEFQEFLENERGKAESPSSTSRDFQTGTCYGIKMCINFDEHYLALIEKEKISGIVEGSGINSVIDGT